MRADQQRPTAALLRRVIPLVRCDLGVDVRDDRVQCRRDAVVEFGYCFAVGAGLDLRGVGLVRARGRGGEEDCWEERVQGREGCWARVCEGSGSEPFAGKKFGLAIDHGLM